MESEGLEALLVRCGADWGNFMDAPDGELFADGVLFLFRIGLYFEKPYEAIIACNQFVRMRRVEAWGAFDLKKLNAERPNSCLYQLPDEKGANRIWLPARVKSDPSVWWSNPMAQQMLYSGFPQGYPQNYPQTAGYNTPLTATGLLNSNPIPTGIMSGCGTTSNTSGS